MRRFLTRIFAAVGFLVTLMAVLGLVAQHYQQKQTLHEPDAIVLSIDFDQPLTEQSGVSPFESLAFAFNQPPASTTLLDILYVLKRASKDPHVKGIVARFGSTEPSMAATQEISAAIKDFRASGKFTYAFGTNYGGFGDGGNLTYILASGFENIWLQPVGTVGLTGLAMFEPFGKSALAMIGIKADFMQREEYKSYMDMATRDEFAPQVRANMQALLDDLARQESALIAANRGWTIDRVSTVMAKGPYLDSEALQEGLVTRLGYEDELTKEIEAVAGKNAPTVDIGTYLSYETADQEDSTHTTKVAWIFAEGEIVAQDGDVGINNLTGDKMLGADRLVGAFDAAAADTNVKAILFRINSPGGDPSASETIRRALMRAQQAGKPVFVSMSDTAASGGYWIAMNADHIVAESGTLTGSIGVLAGKFSGAELLKKLNAKFDAVRTADNAGMWVPTAEFTPTQRARINAMLDATYATFVSNVATARKIPLEKMPDLAKGRVWTGAQAVQIGLVDEVGGYDTTLSAIRKKLGLATDASLILQPYPAPETPMERIEKLMKSFGFNWAAMDSALRSWRQIRTMIAPYLSIASSHQSLTATLPTFYRAH